ncbi:EAL domain-containing protein, partial [Parvibaculum sp.]
MYSSSFRLTNRDIDLAFEADRLFLVCQPKLCLATGGTLGAEAYIRWNHPDYGLLPPGLFLSFIERRERSGELTRFVARAAAETLVRWRGAGLDWPLSINLGAPDLADMGLPGALDGIM